MSSENVAQNTHRQSPYGALWDMGQMHCGICDIGLLVECVIGAENEGAIFRIVHSSGSVYGTCKFHM